MPAVPSRNAVTPPVSPLSPLATPGSSDTARAGFGGVKGRLVVGGTHQPYVATLYLGRAIPGSSPAAGTVIGLSEDSAPKAVQDPATGAFVFTGVPPGTYALIIWNPAGNTVVTKPASSEYLLFQVAPGQVFDLGDVLVP